MVTLIAPIMRAMEREQWGVETPEVERRATDRAGAQPDLRTAHAPTTEEKAGCHRLGLQRSHKNVDRVSVRRNLAPARTAPKASTTNRVGLP